ncbi:hypothetical protein KCP76_15760 [Salmonella enterica subsp. enterica serovar Weltevreden]|nr:hypothetical protein KCP76_15760 [Salmonella enterica subsp. enterica serovar Weltevreden]
MRSDRRHCRRPRSAFTWESGFPAVPRTGFSAWRGADRLRHQPDEGVKVFGELEFWFSFFKSRHHCIMICRGYRHHCVGSGSGGRPPTGIHNLWSSGGFFSLWLAGEMIMSLQMVMFKTRRD